MTYSSTSNEPLSDGSNITEALKEYFPELTQADLEQFLEVYPASDFDSDAQRLQVATGEPDVICARHIIGLAAARKNKAFTYRYNQPVNNATSVYHSSENWMMFLGTSTGYVCLPLSPCQLDVCDAHLHLAIGSTVRPRSSRRPTSTVRLPKSSSRIGSPSCVLVIRIHLSSTALRSGQSTL